MKSKHNDGYLYIVKITINGKTCSYNHDDMRSAKMHYDTEKSQGKHVELFRCKDGKYFRFQDKPCSCAKCAPKRVPHIIHKVN